MANPRSSKRMLSIKQELPLGLFVFHPFSYIQPQIIKGAIKSTIINALVPLICSQFTAGAAITSLSLFQGTTNNSNFLTANKNVSCSSDHASYGDVGPAKVACVVALANLQ